jgi:uncharacterized protein
MNVGHREVWHGRVWRVMPLRLLEERDGLLVLWHPERTPVKRPFAAGRELRIPGEADWTLEDRPSQSSAVVLVRPGTRHSLSLMFHDGRFDHWYINFERDSRWDGTFVDFVDEKLDLVVSAAGAVRVKDEDELEQAAQAGYLDEAQVRAEFDRVLADPPWPTGWETFRPDPSWPVPELPEGWDVV